MSPRWKPLRRILRSDVGTEIDEELRFHLEARIVEYEEQGYSHADAARLAHERFGDAEQVRTTLAEHDKAERSRERRHDFLSDFTQDIRIALRGLRRMPAFAITVLATLAIGIGANTAVFSVVSRELINPLPYLASDRLVLLYSATAQDARGFVSANDISRLQQAGGALTDVAAFGMYGGLTYVGDRETVTWSSVTVGPHFFRALGVTPALGRLIGDRDAGADTAAIVLSYDVWQRDFGGDAKVVGRTLRLNNESFTVIGVTPHDFVPPARAPEVWLPLNLEPLVRSQFASNKMLQAVARLAPGATLAQAEAQVRVLSRSRDAAGATGQADQASLTAVPIRDAMVGDLRPILLVVMGAALLVLLLACVNVAGLFFARSAARRRELAVRAALGAGRWRLVRQLLTESVVLGVGGGALGVLLAFWGKNVLVRLGSGVLSSTGAPAVIDARALAFAVGAALTAGIVAGLAPALLDAPVDPNAALGDASRAATGSRRTRQVGRALVAGQMALAVVLLVGAGLLTRTLVALEHTDLGYSSDQHVLTFSVSLPTNVYPDWPQRSQFFTEWLARLRVIPGVRNAGMANVAPWQGWNQWWVRIDNASGGASAVDSTNAHLARVSDGYFAAAGTPVIAGRGIRASDRPGSLPVVVVSKGFADRWWPRGNAIGGRVRVIGIDSTWRTVVGIVGDVRETPSGEPEPGVYVSAWQVPRAWFAFAVRSDGNAADLLPAIRRELRSLDATLPVVGARTMKEAASSSLAERRLPMLLTGAFALLALALAALGMYGIVAYAVTLRTREIGIRAALGGRRGNIIGLVLRDGLTTALVGIVLGMLVTVGAARVMTGLIYGVSAHDPITYVGTVAVLLLASVGACVVPARRALRVDPVEVLRVE